MNYYEDKLSRGECERYDCGEKASSSVLYECPARHRLEVRRCPEHIGEAVRTALSGVTFPVCVTCEVLALMMPVFEGI